MPTDISILFNEWSVCDVVIWRHLNKESLVYDNSSCKPGVKNITELKYKLPKETPLVGLHAVVEEDEIDALGLILFDTLDSECQEPLSRSAISEADLAPENEFTIDARVEASLTEHENARAHALEALLAYKDLAKARQTKNNLIEEIKKLLAEQPLEIDEPFEYDSWGDVSEL